MAGLLGVRSAVVQLARSDDAAGIVLADVPDGVAAALHPLASELENIRRELGLAPPTPAGGSFQVRSLGSYLLLSGAMELAVPLVLRLAEGGSDIPVLTGLFYPYLLLPFLYLAVGWMAGRRLGLTLVLPVACGAPTVPHVFLLYNATALFQAGVAVAFALAGNLAGVLYARWKGSRRRGDP